MAAGRYNSKDLRLLTAIHFFAGAQARLAHFPWWCCWAYAASVCGTTSADEIFEVGREWLKGWVKQWRKDYPSEEPPALLMDIIACDAHDPAPGANGE